MTTAAHALAAHASDHWFVFALGDDGRDAWFIINNEIDANSLNDGLLASWIGSTGTVVKNESRKKFVVFNMPDFDPARIPMFLDDTVTVLPIMSPENLFDDVTRGRPWTQVGDDGVDVPVLPSRVNIDVIVGGGDGEEQYSVLYARDDRWAKVVPPPMGV